MLRPNLAVADRPMNDFLRRKSLPEKVIHRLRPRGHHPAQAWSIRHCDALVPQAATPNEDNESTFGGYPRGRRRTVRHVNLSGIKPVRHFHVFVETSKT
jgi:hypothetical protein